VNQKKPIFLDLWRLQFPPMAIVSILHRISGVFLFLALPALLYVLALSLRSPADFAQALTLLKQPYWCMGIWAFAVALFYHSIAGIRHIVMDLGFGESLGAARVSAYLVLALSVVFAIIVGCCLC